MAGGQAVAAGLRAWAAGMYETEAAAELLIRACRGLLVDPGGPGSSPVSRRVSARRRAGLRRRLRR